VKVKTGPIEPPDTGGKSSGNRRGFQVEIVPAATAIFAEQPCVRRDAVLRLADHPTAVMRCATA